MKNQEIRHRLEEVMSMIPCPMAGCWGLHGVQTDCYYDQDCECHVLEVWPVGIEEPEDPGGNGHPKQQRDILYELAEFEFSDLVREVSLEHFHFSQRRGLFEIGWNEHGLDFELRIHLFPEESDEVI